VLFSLSSGTVKFSSNFYEWGFETKSHEKNVFKRKNTTLAEINGRFSIIYS